MRLRIGVACLLLVLPATALAQPAAKAPETLLSADTIFYFRYDGLDPHRKAYEQTVVAEVMKGDLGQFMDYLLKVTKESGVPALKDLLARELPPEQLDKLEKLIDQVPVLLDQCNRQGVMIGVEVIDVETPRIQVTIVFPNLTVKSRDAFSTLLQNLTALAQAEVKQSKIGDQTIFELQKTDPVHVAWWQDGDHLVFTVGTEKPDHVLAIASGKRPNLTANPLYKSVAGFNKYETVARGFLDCERGIKLARTRGKEAEKIIDSLGLGTLKSMTMHFGFEGRYDRGTIVINMPGPRKGLLRLASAQQSLELDQLPPIPPDATSFSASQLDLGNLYDVVVQGVETVVEVVSPDDLPKVKDALQMADKFVGVDLRKDLFGSLGSTMVTYNSPGEGLLSAGAGLAIKVKDPKKLQETLDKMIKSIQENTGAPMQLQKRQYHGVDLYTIKIQQEGFFYAPSYAIHKDWLVIGYYPQVVQGYILRSSGKYPTWQPTPLLKEALAAAKKNPNAKVTSITVSDPRPTIKFVLSILPLGIGILNSYVPIDFDISMIPNAHAVTELLFPNVTITVDEGDSIRMESYASLSLPF